VPEACQFVTRLGADGRYYHKAACGLATRTSRLPNYYRACDGHCTRVTLPGDRLAAMLATLGVKRVAVAQVESALTGRKACGGCRRAQELMNKLGVYGCRERRTEIVAAMQQRYDALPKLKRAALFVKAAALSIPAGLAISISPSDPIGSLFDLAVDETEREILERTSACEIYEHDPFRLHPGGVAP